LLSELGREWGDEEARSLDEYAPQYLLSGVAAAGGLYIVVRILNSGADGQFRCQACLWQYQYILFGDRRRDLRGRGRDSVESGWFYVSYSG
jgi:hypothetical protein